MERVSLVKALDSFRLDVTFSDGTRGTVQVKDRLFGPMFAPLKDPAYFAQASVDDYGAICWPNGADLAPDALYREIRGTARATG